MADVLDVMLGVVGVFWRGIIRGMPGYGVEDESCVKPQQSENLSLHSMVNVDRLSSGFFLFQLNHDDD